MSLRDDLEIMASCMEPVDGRPEAAYNRLRAALTPAAIKWLEALPELLKIEADATPGPWYHCQPFMHIETTRTPWGRVEGQRVDFVSTSPEPVHKKIVIPMEGRESSVSSKDMAFIVAMRNKIHEAAALHNAMENEKEQK